MTSSETSPCQHVPSEASSSEVASGATAIPEERTETVQNTPDAPETAELGASNGPQDADASQTSSMTAEIELFLTTFLTIFVAEIGDKTQVTTLLMSAESQSPWIVFLGAGAALVLTSFLGVSVGRWLSDRVSVDTLETITGGILMVISAMLLWDVVTL